MWIGFLLGSLCLLWFILSPPSCSLKCVDVESGALHCFKRRVYVWFLLLPLSIILCFVSFSLKSDILVFCVMILCFSLLNHYVSCRNRGVQTAVALPVDELDELETAVQEGVQEGVPVEVPKQETEQETEQETGQSI